MVQLEILERRDDADLAALYWWRRDQAAAAATVERPVLVSERVNALSECAVPHDRALPGNSLRAHAAVRQVRAKRAAARERILCDAERRAALPQQRREAMVAAVTGLVATAASAAVAAYAAEIHQQVAVGFAVAGMITASSAIYYAVRSLRLMRAAAAAISP